MTTLGVVGAALATGQGVGQAWPPPAAECHDLTITFDHVTARSYDVVVGAVVTRPGVFQLGPGHAYFGTSETPADPAGVPMTATATVQDPEPGEATWTASCVGSSATATVRVPASPAPPRLTLTGPTRVLATRHEGAPDPVRATAVDGSGHPLAATCRPALLPLVPSRTAVTCTTAPDAAGRVARATRVVTVVGAEAQLQRLADDLPAGRLRDLVASAREAVARRDGPMAARRLGLVLDDLPWSGLGSRRAAAVRADVERVARVLGRPIPPVHVVRPGDTVWSVVTTALRDRTGTAPTEHEVALGARLVLARNPGALDRRGVLHPGTVLDLTL